MKPSRLSIGFISSFLLTLFLLQWWQESSYPLLIWLILTIFCTICIVIIILHSLDRDAWIFLSIILGITIAFIRVSTSTHEPTSTSIDSFADGKNVTIEGTVSDEPDKRALSIKYTIDADHLKTVSGEMIVNGKVLVTDYRIWPEFQYGDRVKVSGKLEKPGNTSDFAYDRYLSRYDIYAIMSAGHIEKTDDGAKNPFFAGLYKLKGTMEGQINRLLPEPHAALLAGLLLGSRRGIPEDVLANFQTTGLTHIVAISGYNITIIIAILMGLLFWLPLRWRFVPVVLAIVAFTLLVGASASVVRAAIMGILGLIALQTGRLKDTRLAVLWTLFFMLMWNPKYLWYDAGFQLSFLAVIGLMETADLLQKYLKFLPEALGIRDGLSMTFAAQVFAVPWIVYLFGQLSLISPIANILVAPLIPLAMLFGFLGLITSFLGFFAGQLFAYIAWGCLELILLITKTLGSIPFASVPLPKGNVWILVVYYAIVIGGLIVWKRKHALIRA